MRPYCCSMHQASGTRCHRKHRRTRTAVDGTFGGASAVWWCLRRRQGRQGDGIRISLCAVQQEVREDLKVFGPPSRRIRLARVPLLTPLCGLSSASVRSARRFILGRRSSANTSITFSPRSAILPAKPSKPRMAQRLRQELSSPATCICLCYQSLDLSAHLLIRQKHVAFTYILRYGRPARSNNGRAGCPHGSIPASSPHFLPPSQQQPRRALQQRRRATIASRLQRGQRSV
jgi:hypothetical protein